jgi:hypothetical protein
MSYVVGGSPKADLKPPRPSTILGERLSFVTALSGDNLLRLNRPIMIGTFCYSYIRNNDGNEPLPQPTQRAVTDIRENDARMGLIPTGRPDSAFIRAIVTSIRTVAAYSLVDYNFAWDHWFNYHCSNLPRTEVAAVTAAVINAILRGAQDVGDLKFLPKVTQAACMDYLAKVECDYPGAAKLALDLRKFQGELTYISQFWQNSRQKGKNSWNRG